MATSVACVIGLGISDGELIDSLSSRWSSLSSFDVVGGASPLLNGAGVLPTGGNPLGVTQTATPGMRVTVIAGRVVVPANSASLPPFALTLTANTDLDIAAANVTNPRIDLVIAKVYSPGNDTAAGTIEILTGTAAASPSRPALPTGDYHCVSLATVTVPANASTIVNANITKVESDSWSTATSDARYMSAPGGCVYKSGWVTMSQTRRQALAALYSPGTPLWDATNTVLGVSNGTDIVPVTPRTLYQVVGASSQTATSTTPVTVASSGTLTAFGGSRRIQITMSGKLGTNGDADTRWAAGRVFLTGAGTITIPSSTNVHARVWGASTSATTYSQHTFSATYTFTVASGTFSVLMSVLLVGQGGAGAGGTAICSEGCLLIEDVGPA